MRPSDMARRRPPGRRPARRGKGAAIQASIINHRGGDLPRIGTRPAVQNIARFPCHARRSGCDQTAGMANMTLLASGSLDAVASPPTASEQVVDVDHLARMTLGDRKLEREVLELFDRQA